MASENRSERLAQPLVHPRRMWWGRWPGAMARFARRKPMGALGGLFILLPMIAAVFAPVLAPADPLAVSGANRLLAPSAMHLMGTDEQGRDVFSRVVFGARSSLYVATLAVIINLVIATCIGILTGYRGGMVDAVLQRFVDGMMAFPFLVLILTLMMAFGSSMTNVGVVIGLVTGIRDSRVVRGATFSIKENQYVEASRAIGCSDLRIMTQCVARNLFAPIMVIATLLWGNAILAEASLSFLGFGVPPPLPSWGNMISGEARRWLEVAPWMGIFPGIALSLTVFGFNMFGDAMRDILDPRMRGTEKQ